MAAEWPAVSVLARVSQGDASCVWSERPSRRTAASWRRLAITLSARSGCWRQAALGWPDGLELIATLAKPAAAALAGVAAEFGVIMLLYLKQAWVTRPARGQGSDADLLDAIREGAVLRVRPKAMTVAVIIAGLVLIMCGGGAGSEVMQRIARPGLAAW